MLTTVTGQKLPLCSRRSFCPEMQEKCPKMQLTALLTQKQHLYSLFSCMDVLVLQRAIFIPSLTRFSISPRKLKLKIWFRTSSVRLNKFPLKSSKFPSMFGISRAYVCLDLQPLKWDDHWMFILFLEDQVHQTAWQIPPAPRSHCTLLCFS